MALTERHRSVLYQRLNDVVHDEEAVGAMLSHFSARDMDEPATKDLVHTEIAATKDLVHTEIAATKELVRTEVAATRDLLHTEVAATRDLLHTEIAATRVLVHTEVAAVRAEVAATKDLMRTEMAATRDFVRAEVADLEQRLITFVHQEIRSSMRWTIGFFVSTQGTLVAALAVFG